MFQLIYELYFFLSSELYYILSFMLDDTVDDTVENSFQSFQSFNNNNIKSDDIVDDTVENSFQSFNNNIKSDDIVIVIQVSEKNVYIKKNKHDILCTLLDLDYLENNYSLCDYKENLIEV